MAVINSSTAVEAFLAALQHPLTGTVRRLRAGILALDAEVSESIKWNAPNFRYRGEDRATFQLRAQDRVQIILHRGVTAKPVAGFHFPDPSGRIQWAAPDRGIITITADAPDADATLLATIHAWMRNTTE